MVGLLGAGPWTTVATHIPEMQFVARVKLALKSLSYWRLAGLVPDFCDAYVKNVYCPFHTG
jgi:hypothetical protein